MLAEKTDHRHTEPLSFGFFCWTPELSVLGSIERLAEYKRLMQLKSIKPLKGWRGSVKMRGIGALLRLRYRKLKRDIEI